MGRVFRLNISGPLLFLAALDLGLLWLAGHCAIRLSLTPPPPGFAPALAMWVFILVQFISLIACGALSCEGLRTPRIIVVRGLAALSIGALLLGLASLLLPALVTSPSSFVRALGIVSPLLLLSHMGIGWLIGSRPFVRRLLFLGAGPRARALADMVRSRPGQISVGHVHFGTEDALPGAFTLGPKFSLVDLAYGYAVTDMIVALEDRRDVLPMEDMVRLRFSGVRITNAARFLEQETGRVDLDWLTPSTLLYSDGFWLQSRMGSLLKRGFDLALSLVLLVALWPVFALAILLIRLDSPGPAVFKQIRVGRNGRLFELIKLRSMHLDAEADGAARWAALNDPRITRIGRWLRPLHLDELPQLWNVLRGDMSFVGPRPERPEFVDKLKRHIPYYEDRHRLRPGLTGWAQINHHYAACLNDARIKQEYDLYYAKHGSLLLDLGILLQTVRVLIWPDGAR